MNLVDAAIQVGFEDDHIISVAPPFASYKTKKKNPEGELVAAVEESDGKQPGIIYQLGLWGSYSWTQPQDKAKRAQAAAQGCNVGLRLALPCPSLDNTKIVAIDIDLSSLDDGIAETKLCDQIERALVTRFAEATHDNQKTRYVVWVRKTVSYRATILVRIPSDEVPEKYILIYKNPTNPLKPLTLDVPMAQQTVQSRKLQHRVEFLVGYTVIAGLHKSRAKIEWYRSDVPDKKFDVPLITADSLPLFNSWQSLIETCSGIIDRIMLDADCPVEGLRAMPSMRTVNSVSHATPARIQELRPPSTSALLRLLRELPNDQSVMRKQYADIAYAIAGAWSALRDSKMLTVDDTEEILDAAANWVLRYEGQGYQGQPDYDFDDERLKLETDFFRRPSYRTGWPTLLMYARGLNMDTSSYELSDAQEAFTAEEKPAFDLPWDSNPVHILTSKSEYSEFWLATEFQRHAADRVRYVPDMKTWIAFSEDKRGWFAQSGTHWMRHQIQHFLTNLVERNSALPREDCKALLSAYKINAIERILQDRLVQERETLNDAPWFLQTPSGAIDLRTGKRITVFEQMRNLDLRYTKVSPQEGKTPLWDSVIFHLCDDNHDTANWLKFYLAYSLIGSPSAHKITFLHGQGMNGKSTLLNVMSGILGGYAGAIDREVWLERSADKHPASLYMIRDVRFGYTSEMPPQEEWNESRLKAVSGQDDIEARPLYGAPCVFRSRAALVLVGQTIPTFRKVDKSISRRMAIIGTTRMPRVPIPHLADTIIKDEGAAVLYDLVQRCGQLWQVGEVLPEMTSDMESELKEYLDANDPLYAWASSECILGADAGDEPIEISLLFQRYQAFLNRAGGETDVLRQVGGAAEAAFRGGIRRLGTRAKDASGRPLPPSHICGIKLKVAVVQAA